MGGASCRVTQRIAVGPQDPASAVDAAQHHAAGLGEPDLASGDGQQRGRPLRLQAVGVSVVVQAPDPRPMSRIAPKLRHPGGHVGRVEHISGDDATAATVAGHGVEELRRPARPIRSQPAGVVRLVPHQPITHPRIAGTEALELPLVLPPARQRVRQLLAAQRVREAEQDVHTGLSRLRHPGVQQRQLGRVLQCVPGHRVARVAQPQALPRPTPEHLRLLLTDPDDRNGRRGVRGVREHRQGNPHRNQEPNSRNRGLLPHGARPCRLLSSGATCRRRTARTRPAGRSSSLSQHSQN